MEKITNAELIKFVERDGPIFNLLKAWTIDFLERIKPANSEDWAEAWSTHVLDAIYDGTRGDSPSAAMHKEKRDKLSDKTQQFTESGYNKLDYNNFIRIIHHNCYNRKIYDIYGIDRNMTKFIWEHVRSTKSEGNSSKVGSLRNYLEHDVKENNGLNSEAAATDVKNLINGLKSRETGFLRGFPYNTSPELHKHAYNVIKEVHKLWERLPANEKGWDVWEPEEIIPTPAGSIPEPVPKPISPIGKKGNENGNYVSKTAKSTSKKDTESVTRENPQLIIFLLDESSSMGTADMKDGTGNKRERGKIVVDKINEALLAMIQDCSQRNATKNYYYVSILGYCDTTSENIVVEDLFDYATSADVNIKNAVVRPITSMYPNLADNVNYTNWIHYKPRGMTPQRAAFKKVKEIITAWDNHSSWKDTRGWKEVATLSNTENPKMLKYREDNVENKVMHPPIVISITDGRFDSDDTNEPDIEESPIDVVQEIRNTPYKHFEAPVIMNVYVSGDKNDSEIFPHKEPEGSPYLKHLYQLSSPLTENMLVTARKHPGFENLSSSSRALVYNADTVGLETILRIGTIGTRVSVTNKRESRDDIGY